jgi:methionyl-tRNA formyltransferase
MPATPDSLRIVAYCVLPQAYQLIAGWCADHGHKLLLVVTTPGPKSRPTNSYRGILDAAPRDQEILVTTRMQRTLLLLRELQPDLVLSFTFPYRLPAEVTTIPRYGGVNLHPTPLPAYRGPNPFRSIYEGYPTLGSTLHWIAPDFDTGSVLAQTLCPLPDDRSIGPLMGAWFGTMRPTLEQGIPRALAGEPGTAQDESKASYGGFFTPEERRLDWNTPATLLQGRAVVLNLNSEGQADHDAPGCTAVIDGAEHAVQRITPLAGLIPPAAPGTVLARTAGAVTLCCADAVLQVEMRPL